MIGFDDLAVVPNGETLGMTKSSMFLAPVAQWIEQDGSNVLVGGSSPSGGAK